MYYILFYDVVENFIEKRESLRSRHLALVKDEHLKGNLVMAGALTEPVDRAVLIFTSQPAAENFVRSDPYVTSGLVKSYEIRKWNAVIGPGITSP